MSESVESSAEQLAAGLRIGPYRVVRQLGGGGMGTVYEAIHETIERRVAVKVLLARFASDARAVTRLLNEARAVNRVGHPGLVQVFDCGQLADGRVYILMELLDGETLTERAHRKRFSVLESLRLARQIAGALAAAHDKGIVHRDLKPDNVMIVADPDTVGGERAKVLDFGIAKLLDPQGVVSTRTCPETVLGTPVYMAPEQCRGAAEVDDRADVYSFGVMLFWLFAGQPPFVGGLGELIAQHLTADVPRLSERCPGVMPELEDLVNHLLVKSALLRPSMAEVNAALAELEAQVSIEHSLSTGRQWALRAPLPSHSSAPGRRSAIFPSPRGTSPSVTPQGFSLRSLPSARPRWHIGLVIGVCVLAATAVVITPQELPLMRRAAVPTGVRDKTAEMIATSAAILPPPLPPPTRRVVVRSSPTGALVLRAADRQLLGQTPWQTTQPLHAGETELLLTFPGYADQLLHLPWDTDFVRELGLVKVQPDVASRPQQRVRSPGRNVAKSKSRGNLDDAERPKIELEE